MALRERPTDAIGLCVFIVALYELQMPDTPFYADFTSVSYTHLTLPTKA